MKEPLGEDDDLGGRCGGGGGGDDDVASGDDDADVHLIGFPSDAFSTISWSISLIPPL